MTRGGNRASTKASGLICQHVYCELTNAGRACCHNVASETTLAVGFDHVVSQVFITENVIMSEVQSVLINKMELFYLWSMVAMSCGLSIMTYHLCWAKDPHSEGFEFNSMIPQLKRCLYMINRSPFKNLSLHSRRLHMCVCVCPQAETGCANLYSISFSPSPPLTLFLVHCCSQPAAQPHLVVQRPC